MSVQKTPISRTLPIYVRKRILDAINTQGMALPGTVRSVSGAIVTVDFDVIPSLNLPGNVQMPLATSVYARVPIQVGDRGVCMPIDAYVGGVSGLGSAKQTLTAQGNLTNLVWVPVGNKGWSAVDPNAYVLQGPNGVVLRDMGGNSVITLTPNGITIIAGGHTLLINASGISLDGIVFAMHGHTLVQSGTDISGPVNP